MKISVQYGYTKNLGNYESERLQVGIERDLEGDETPEKVWAAEFASCKDFVYESLNLKYEPSENAEQEVREALSRRGRRRNKNADKN